jgi:RHS repeat-associated protein
MTIVLLCTDLCLSVLLAGFTSGHTKVAYTPFGHSGLRHGPAGGLAFNGERPQPLTGHYLLGNGYRAFNPTLMRFNSPDSWSPFGDGGLNAYAYCAGDPINNTDPDGHWGSLAYVARFVGKLKSGRADRVARQVLGIDAMPVRVANPGPGPSDPVSPRTRRRQAKREINKRYRATAAGLRKTAEAKARYVAKLTASMNTFNSEEAAGMYSTKISTKNFGSIPIPLREQVLDKAKTIYGVQRLSGEEKFETRGGLLDVHPFDLAVAVEKQHRKSGNALRFAKKRRMDYIKNHVSYIRTDQ